MNGRIFRRVKNLILHRIGKSGRPHVKLPAHRAGLPGKELFFYIVPLDPAYKAGLAGALPVEKPGGNLSAKPSPPE